MPRANQLNANLPDPNAIVQHLRITGPQTSGQLVYKFSHCSTGKLVCYLQRLAKSGLLKTSVIIQRSKERLLYGLPSDATGLEDVYRRPLPTVSRSRVIIRDCS